MSSMHKCPQCGTALPAGTPLWLCPKCLLGQAAEAATPKEPPAAAPTAGSVFCGPPGEALLYRLGTYELVERIGQGGMGVVYKARQISLDRDVAVKVLSLAALAGPEAVHRFRTEAVTAGSLQHPNIVAVHEVGLAEGQHYLVMDYVPGPTLADLTRNGPLPGRQAAQYLRTIAEAVHFAHERGILHRDLKPSNVLIDANDQPRLTDFGLAKRLVDDQLATPGSQVTLSGQVLGSPAFIPPEQASGKRGRVGRRSDVYALGAILYHLLTGRPPFVGETLADILRQVLNEEPLRPRLLNSTVPQDLETICLKCIEKESDRRYSTAQALAEELGRFLEHRPILAQPLGPTGKVWRWCRRKPALASLGAGVIVLLLAVAIGSPLALYQINRARLDAVEQSQRAEAEALLARRNAYAADMKKVQRALDDSDLGGAMELLNRQRPDAKSEVDLRGWEWRYFWSRCQSDEWFTLCQYSNYVSALAFSADGQWLACQHGGTVALWDAVARRPMLELPGNDLGKALAFSPRGNLLAWGRRDTNGAPVVSVLDVSAQKEIASLPLSAALRSVAFSPDVKLIAALSVDGSVRVCEVASQRVVTQFLTGSLDLRPSVYTVSSATRSSPGEVTVAPRGLSAQVGTGVWTAHPHFVLHYGCVLFSPDGRWLAVGEAKPRIRLLDRATSREKVIKVPPPADGITALAFSPDGRLLAAGCGALDNNVHIWDLVADTEVRLAGHSGWVTALAFSPDGQTLASASGDQTIRLWDVARQAERRSFQGSADEIWALAWSPDGKSLVTGGRDGAVQYWDPAAKPTVTPYSVLPALIYPYGLGFFSDSKSFLTATRPEGEIVRWDTTSLQVVERLRFLGTNHISLALSKDARWLALGDAVGRVQVWDLPARRLVTNLVFKGAVVGALLFSPHDHMLLCGAISPARPIDIKLWKVPGWEEISLSGIDLRGLEYAALSPDERIIAVGYGGKAVWWNLATGKKEASFESQGASVGRCVAFSPDGRVFAAAGSDEGLTLWDVASRQPRSVGRAYRNLPYRIAFSPGGRRVIASGSSPREVMRLWDVETGRDVATLPGEPGSYNIFFSPDGNTLCGASVEQGLVPLWRAPSFAEIEAAEKKSKAH